MKDGNWVPISKGFVEDLPKTRPYTKLEAAYSLQVDYDNGSPVTVSGLSTLWGWSRNRVTKFLSDMGVMIFYEENTKNKQNQKGQIAIQIMDRKRTDQGQKRFIIDSRLADSKDRKRTDQGQKKDRKGSTTIYPNPYRECEGGENCGEENSMSPEEIQALIDKIADDYNKNFGNVQGLKINIKDFRFRDFLGRLLIQNNWNLQDFEAVHKKARESWLNWKGARCHYEFLYREHNFKTLLLESTIETPKERKEAKQQESSLFERAKNFESFKNSETTITLKDDDYEELPTEGIN